MHAMCACAWVGRSSARTLTVPAGAEPGDELTFFAPPVLHATRAPDESGDGGAQERAAGDERATGDAERVSQVKVELPPPPQPPAPPEAAAHLEPAASELPPEGGSPQRAPSAPPAEYTAKPAAHSADEGALVMLVPQGAKPGDRLCMGSSRA